jgi:hypothetical protein
VSKILYDLVELRRLVGGLKAERKERGPTYAVKSAKDLMDKLRAAADKLGMPIAGAVVDQQVTIHQNAFVMRRDGAVQVNMASITATVKFASSDGSYELFVGSGTGAAEDDKAMGKASTYAWKDAIIKALSLPDAEMVDTDDEDLSQPQTPSRKPPAAIPAGVTVAGVVEALRSAKTPADRDAALVKVKQVTGATPKELFELNALANETKRRIP